MPVFIPRVPYHLKGHARRAIEEQAASPVLIYVLAMVEPLVSCVWLQEHWIDKKDPNIVLLDGEQIIFIIMITRSNKFYPAAISDVSIKNHFYS